ncbi:MAG: helix-turn-helix domain-containing protein [Solirubrobacteraceae bacterium]
MSIRTPARSLRALRRATGLKVGVFATRVGCSKSHLTNCENGYRAPSPELAEVIAKEFTRLLGQPYTAAIVLGTVPDKPPPQPKRDPKGTPRRQDREPTKGPRRTQDAA